MEQKQTILAMRATGYSVKKIALSQQCSPSLVKRTCEVKKGKKPVTVDDIKREALKRAKFKGKDVETLLQSVFDEIDQADFVTATH